MPTRISGFLLLGLLIVHLQPVNAEQWDFDSSAGGFRALGKGVTTVVASDSPSGGKALRVSGPLSSLPVAAASGDIPMSPRQFWRLTARVKFEGASKGTPLPSVGCVYSSKEPGTFLGRALLDGPGDPGAWRRLSVEFRVPLGATRGRIAVGSCTGSPVPGASNARSTVYLDDIRLEPIACYSISDRYTLDPLPSALARARGVHPRLYLTPEKIAALKAAVGTTHAALWNEVRAQADRLAGQNPPAYKDESEWKNIEQLYMRPVGEAMPYLALAYVLTGERKYLDGAVKWAEAACGYPTWGLHEFEGADLSTGHQLYGLALLYDWCYSDLNGNTRRMIRATIMKRASWLATAAARGIIVRDDAAWKVHPWPEWDEAWLQNHLWINACALGVAGIALFDETPDALGSPAPDAREMADPARWIAFAVDRYRTAFAFFGPDGASHEGPGYWSYGVEYLLKFMDPARDLLGVDFFDHPWWRRTASYRLAMSLPRASWAYSNLTVDYGDSPRSDWYGPDYLLRRLAGEYRDGHAQWLAESIDAANAEHPVSRWLNLLWYDPSVAPAPPEGLPTLVRFPDIDIVTARSDWSGSESFLFFKCGPYIGESALREMTYCPSSAHHVHPDTGNFMLFGAGEWLIRDDGYRAKLTGQHNTLIVDGGEQLGGGGPIFDGSAPHAVQSRPRIVRAESTPAFDVISGDATLAYPKSSGLTRFVRHLVYLKPDILIVADDIALDRPRDLELRFHPEQGTSVRDGAAFLMTGKKAAFRLEPLTPANATASAESLVTLPKEPLDLPGALYTIRLRTVAQSWRNVVALSWADAGNEAKKVVMSGKGEKCVFKIGGKVVEFDWRTGRAGVK